MTWRYDEMRQIGIDFESSGRVAQYERKQGTTTERERHLVERLGIAPGQLVVDLGCGTGSFARAAAQAGASVRAIDVSRAMIDRVRTCAADEGLRNVSVEHAGFLTFDVPAHSVDVLVSRFALHHLPDLWKQVALLRIARALRPAGCFYLQDVVFSFDAADYESALERWVDRMPRESGFSRADFETHVREEYSTYAWVLEGFIARAGLAIVHKAYDSVEYAEYRCRPIPAHS